MKLPRVHARVTVQGPALVSSGDSTTTFEVSNLSASGARLHGSSSMNVGEEFDVSLHVGAGEPIQVHARVVRVDTLSDGAFDLAVTFLALSAELESRLTQTVTEVYKTLGARVLGLVRSEMQRRGITDVSEIADELHRMKEEQAQAHLFSSDLYTERGSNSTASIVSGTTGKKRDCIVWSLNLYLGLNRHPKVIEAARQALLDFGTGCGTSAASGGLNSLHHEIELRVASMVGKEKALVFSTGYSANLGALSALPGPKDLLLLDREAHASMFDGVRLSGRKFLAFKHNDVADLAEKLERYGPLHENIFVVVESAYSMSGDLAPLKEIVALKKQRRFFLYVDEAHTFGFYGDQGRGYCWEQGVTRDVDFIMSTFSKSTASIGGFLAADARFCTLLQASSTPYIFQACLSPADAATILAALDEIQGNPVHMQNLHANNRLMRELLVAEGFDLGTSQSPVIPVYVPDLEKLYRLCAMLHQDGIFSVPVVYPAVGVNEGRIRFIVNAHHTEEHIRTTVSLLAAHGRELGAIGTAPRE